MAVRVTADSRAEGIADMDYQLDLRAASVTDVIGIAGGWICDRVAAGSITTGWMPQHGRVRAPRILRADVRALTDDEHRGEAGALPPVG
jgi:hypothetical protein